MLGIFFGRLKTTKKRKVKKPAASYLLHREAARGLIAKRLEHYASYYKVPYNRVAIRDQRRCWGSCSSKGNLNFSYKLLFLPPCLRDYIIVHELSHLRVLNHSASFWLVVSELMPDCLQRAGTLRSLERTIGTGVRTLQGLKHDTVTCSFCQADARQVLIPIENSLQSEISLSSLRSTTESFTR